MTFCGSTFYCFPVAKAWDESIEGWCVDRAKIYYSAAAFNILNDIFLVAIPFPFLITLQVAQKQKIVLYSVFACGVMWVTLPEPLHEGSTSNIDQSHGCFHCPLKVLV